MGCRGAPTFKDCYGSRSGHGRPARYLALRIELTRREGASMTTMTEALRLVPSDAWIPARAVTRVLGHGASAALGALVAKRLIDRREVARASLERSHGAVYEYRAVKASA